MALHLGSGLHIAPAPDREPVLRACREGPGRWRAEVAGIRNETIVRTWSAAETYPTAAEAIAAAKAERT